MDVYCSLLSQSNLWRDGDERSGCFVQYSYSGTTGSFLNELMQQGKSGGSHLYLLGVAVGYITSTSVPLARAQSYPNFSAAG